MQNARDPQPPHLDRLIQRLREQAAHEEAERSAQAAIGAWVGRWRQRLKPLFEAKPPTLLDTQAPHFAELICAHRDDDAFIVRAYWHLLGRAPDEEGAAYHHQLVQQQGRIEVLVALAQAEEVQCYCHQRDITLPMRLRRLTQWQQRLTKRRGIRRLGARLWRAYTRHLWKQNAAYWRGQACYYEHLAGSAQNTDSDYLITSTLLEMADVMQKSLNDKERT